MLPENDTHTHAHYDCFVRIAKKQRKNINCRMENIVPHIMTLTLHTYDCVIEVRMREERGAVERAQMIVFRFSIDKHARRTNKYDMTA